MQMVAGLQERELPVQQKTRENTRGFPAELGLQGSQPSGSGVSLGGSLIQELRFPSVLNRPL